MAAAYTPFYALLLMLALMIIIGIILVMRRHRRHGVNGSGAPIIAIIEIRVASLFDQAMSFSSIYGPARTGSHHLPSD
ncbi:hypothetical protein MesoLj131a_58210 [Mesorhizobium sp. 131-2-1]|nr:hypothetical protein MesoLj131a_58210 [Mesorhizobium sp. 131-2-1]